jgi:predicted transposase/invertase (TIGR01784 family)
MSEIINPHDSFFRETFGRREVAADILREQLPEEIVRELDLDTLTIVKDSFTDKELRQHFSDILYTARWKQADLYLCFLFEHKSFPDHWVNLQLLRYQVKFWDQYRKQHPKKKHLPAVVSLVLYHGRKAWQLPGRFRPLVIPNNQELDPFIPDFGYHLYDLSALSDDEIRGGVYARITQLVLRHIFDPDLASKLPGILSLLREIKAKQDALEMLETLLRYVVKATKKFDEHQIREVLNQSCIEEDIMQDFIDKYIEQGVQQGERKLLASQLKHRFGTLPEWACGRIEKADAAAIEQWSIRLFSASSIDEVFH